MDDFKALKEILINKDLLGGELMKELVFGGKAAGDQDESEGEWNVREEFRGQGERGVKRMKRISLTLRCVEKVGKGLFGK